MNDRLSGKVAIVTGASRGIGLAIAQRLVAEGAKVCVTARNAQPLAEVVASLGDRRAIAVAGKAHDPAHQDEAVTRTVEEFGGIDILVNNAATNPVFGPLMTLDQAAAAKIFEVNVLAPLAWTRKVHEARMAADGGAVVNVASIAGIRAAPGIAAYGMSKAALISMTQQLAVELGPAVRVNAVAPAVVKTRFAAALYEGREAEILEGYPLHRLGVPDDIAGAVAFLASDDASWISGQTLVIDGGVTAGGREL